MATWQFRAWVVPFDAVMVSSDRLVAAVLDGSSHAWSGLPPGWSEPIARALGLERRASWNRQACLFGAEDGTYLEELVSTGHLTEVELGLDARKVDMPTCTRLAEALNALRAELITPKGQRVRAVPSEIALAIRQSDAWRFVVSPEDFLRAMGSP